MCGKGGRNRRGQVKCAGHAADNGDVVNSAETSSAFNGNGHSLAGRYLALTLGSESCAIPVHKVCEIVRLPGFPGVQTPTDAIDGIIHLRGKRIPVLDLRVAFGLPASPTTSRTCIVIVQLRTPAGNTQLAGLVVDAVEEIIHLKDSDIWAASGSDTVLHHECLLGMARVEGAVRKLLNVDRFGDRWGRSFD